MNKYADAPNEKKVTNEDLSDKLSIMHDYLILMNGTMGKMAGNIDNMNNNISKLVDLLSSHILLKKKNTDKKPLKIKMKGIYNLNTGSSDSSNSRRSKSLDK